LRRQIGGGILWSSFVNRVSHAFEGFHMRHARMLVVGCLIYLSACAPFVLAPGAAEVRVTNVPADVVGCAAVGNIRVPQDSSGMLDIARAVGQMKNQTIGLGGNVAFVTDGSPRFPAAGVAYHCPAKTGAGT
jgi:hypothetical protein